MIASIQPPPARAARPLGLPFPGQPGPDGAFWSGAIGAGAGIMITLIAPLDVLSSNIAQLPTGTAATRPAVAHYLGALKAVALAWNGATRPALLHALAGLTQVGAGLGQPLALAALANCQGDAGKAALRLLDNTARRLAVPAQALAALGADLDARLDGMGEATLALQSDTLLVSERLQADQVHAFLLSQHASALKSKLDEANLRQDAYWLQGPHAEQIRQEIAMHGSALEGVRRQLDHLQAEQGATRAEARYLQQLMPSLSGYLGALDRLAGAVRTAHAGSGAMLGELRALKALLADAHEQAGHAAPGTALQSALQAALPRWRALAASAARLRTADAARTRGARQT
jgi:hypothetical protein